MRALVIVVALGSTAAAEPVNLLTHSVATVAVSSTVDSATFLPDHLVDGDKTTAWNSAPGDSGWIAFRVPANAHVDAVKMTVGFTKGDWFKQNLRIQRISIEHAGQTKTVDLDPENKELQTIKIDDGGGDYKISVSNTVAGTNKDWNEIVVSELEVWGTAADMKVQKPHVVIGSLDIDCVRSLWPTAKGGRIKGSEAVRRVAYWDPICIVDHGTGKAAAHTTTVALMNGDKVADRFDHGFGESEQQIQIEDFKLGDENAVIITEENAHYGEMTADVKSTHTLYRIKTGKLVAVTSYETHSQGAEQWSESHDCKLAVGASRKPLPELVLRCEDAGSSAEGKPSPKQTSVTKLHWNGKRYE